MTEALLGLNIILTGIVIYLLLNNRSGSDNKVLNSVFDAFQSKVENFLKNESSLNRRELGDSEKRLREEIIGLFKGFGDSLALRMMEFNKSLENLTDKNDLKMEKIKEAVEGRLERLQKENNEKLEAMRQTVDEKLHSTIEKRFGESFKLVSERLELVQKGLGEMQTIAIGVGDLKKVLSNVKTRGAYGEAQLGNLIEEILTPDQYGKNVKVKPRSDQAVEYAIKLPGASDEIKHVWLPIDSKFPLEDYQKLINAQDVGDIESIKIYSKALEDRIKSEAKNIKDRYIHPPYTTDFGILFLPYESLFAEVLRVPGLYEKIRQEHKVTIAGPTTVQTILNSLHMGFRTLAIQKRSSEVWIVLDKVRAEFGKFGDLLEKTAKKIQESGNTIEDAITKTRTIQGKLNKVQEMEPIGIETLTLDKPSVE